VAGILALTLLGVILIFGLHINAIRLAVPVTPSGDGKVFVNLWDRGYVSANGTWVIDQDRMADPINVSNVSCVRNENICYDAQARISRGSFDSYLYSDLERYPIVRWDDSTVQFQNDSTVCVTYIYVIDRATQKLSGRRVKKD